MFFNTNQVMLLGHISTEHIKTFYSSSNQLSVVFELRTADTWLSREGEVKKHYDFHNIIIRDIGKRDVASRYMPLIVPGNKVLVQGRLRSHMGSDNTWTNRVCEIDASSIELISTALSSVKKEYYGKKSTDAGTDVTTDSGADTGSKDTLSQSLSAAQPTESADMSVDIMCVSDSTDNVQDLPSYSGAVDKSSKAMAFCVRGTQTESEGAAQDGDRQQM